jgi:hypothetical protein
MRLYLLLLIVALPVDWFGPTGLLLREGGAKPAIPLMIAVALITLMFWDQQLWTDLPWPSRHVLWLFGLIFVCGLTGFCVNLAMGWSRFDASKSPLTQFVTQAGLFLLAPVLIVTHTQILRDRHWSSYAIELIPWAAALHLGVAALEFVGIFHYDRLPLSLFRTGYEANSMRLSGMTSEPSYFGTMAALYALPLLFAFPGKLRWLYRMLAALLFLFALTAGGKTVLPVGLCGLLAYAWYARLRIFSLRNVSMTLLVAMLAVLFLAKTSPFDVRENLSSAMRFGSTLTSLNVALAGYGITGVGFGQFHFMFQERFMPSFLLYSPEALAQMASTAYHRTSTYNLFTRYWVETGVIGLGLFLTFLVYLFRLARREPSRRTLVGVLMLGSSLGFLLTQEPYCYPPLIFAASLILAASVDHTSSLAGHP